MTNDIVTSLPVLSTVVLLLVNGLNTLFDLTNI
jgi:hypothetical protein